MGWRTSPPATLLASIRIRADDRGPGGRGAARRWPPGGPTCTRRSRSTTPRRSRSPAAGREHEEPIAGEGAPLVAEFCVAELGAVLGCSSTAAKKLIGHALELRHRLPRLWAQVHAGRVPAWRARLVAEETIHSAPALTPEAAAFVDGQVAAVAGRVGPAQLDRLVAEAIKRFDLATPDRSADPEDGYLYVDPRHATIDTHDVHFAGTLHLEADLDLADGLDLDRVLAHGAADAQGARVDRVPQRAPRQGPRRPRADADRARPPHRTGDGGQRDEPRTPTGCPSRGRSCSTPTSTPRWSVSRPCSGRPGGWRSASGWCCSTRCRPGAATPAPRSPSSRSSTSTPSSTPTPTRCPTGSASRSLSGIARACSRGAPAPPDAATSTTSSPTTPTPQQRADPSRVRRRPTTSPPCAASTTGSRPTPPGATRWTSNGVFEWTSPHGHRYRRDHTGTTAIDPTRGSTDASAWPPRHPATPPTMTPPRTPPPNR